MAEISIKSPGDIPCSLTSNCSLIANAICNEIFNYCACDQRLPVFVDSISQCTKEVELNATCQYDQQCLAIEDNSQCSVKERRCVCLSGYRMQSFEAIGVKQVKCVTTGKSPSESVDPTLIGMLVSLALMFIIICVVLRLFSKARFRENRSIFNTPNPRLMNASLFKDSKLLSPASRERRSSRASVRGPPSRAPSITSVNKDGAGRSPNGSLKKGRRGSTLSTTSATGSAAAAAPSSAKRPSPTPEEKEPNETTVAIETVD